MPMQMDMQCTELWEQYEPRLRKLCELKLQCVPDEVDDVISELFLQLCKKIRESGMPNDPKAWLYSVLHNKINDTYRRRYKEKAFSVSCSVKT